MAPERLLVVFNSALYCVNAVLWQWYAHKPGMAALSLAVACVGAFIYRKTGEQ
jgi:hypothetical protein